jgi:hypothetical protein
MGPALNLDDCRFSTEGSSGRQPKPADDPETLTHNKPANRPVLDLSQHHISTNPYREIEIEPLQ